MSSYDADQRYQQAESLKAQGRFTEAEAGYRSALNADPQCPQVWWALGDLYAQMENFPAVERCCRQILAGNPGIPEVYLYLGMALQRQGRLDEAHSALQTASTLNPALADASYQLGVVQQSLGKTGAAVASYELALKTSQDPGPVLYNLSVLYHAQGRIETAFRHACDALQAQPASLKYAQHFVKLLNAACPPDADADLSAQILRCFEMRGLDTAPLMKPCMTLLAGDFDIRRAVGLALRETPRALEAQAARGVLDRLFGNKLLRNLLLHTKIASPEFEVLLCALRRLALAAASGASTLSPENLFRADDTFAEVLACQFFNTDYAAFVAGDEAAAVAALVGRMEEELGRESPVDPGFKLRLATCCMYRPFTSLDGVERIMGIGANALTAALPLIVQRQWSDYRTEGVLRDRIETLTPIATGVSTAVRQQYEESPYPRWFSVDLCEPVACRDMLTSMFPHFEAPDFDLAPIDILAAGCGTGHHAIMLAARIENSAMLAVDLSKTSLAYAMRKADEACMNNISFAQADILELGSLDCRFQIIESVGVLHHMKEPQVGLKVLTGLLVSGGLMRLGLYSALGRRAVAAARQYIADRGFETTADGIRAARRALLALDTNHPAYPATRFRDFYTLSECRDLLFHVQERCMSIPELARMLDECSLRFVGFSLDDVETRTRYQARYPDDRAMTDLSHWHAYEQTYPNTFEAMYQFWCQKI